MSRLLSASETRRLVLQLFLCWFIAFAILYVINPQKSAFPATVAVLFFMVAALLRRSTVLRTLRDANIWLVGLGTIFLLLFVFKSIAQAWRDHVYIVPMIFAGVVLLDSMNKSIQDRIRRSRQD